MARDLFGNRPTRWLLIISFLLPLLAAAYLGQNSRYIADDFCTSSNGLARGVVGMLDYYYNTWSGSYTDLINKAIIAQFGPQFMAVLPTLILALWLGATTWTLRQLTYFIPVRYPLFVSFLLACAIIYSTLHGAPSIIQSLYWLAASVKYTAPLALLTLYLGICLWTLRTHSRLMLIVPVCVILTFIGGGISEAYVALQTTVCAMLLLLSVLFVPPTYRRRAALLFAAGLAGSLAGLAVTALAPGTGIRMAAFTDHAPFWLVIVRSIRIVLSYMATTTIVYTPFSTLIMLILTGMIAYGLQAPRAERDFRPSRRQSRWLLLLSLGGAIVLAMSIVTPVIFSTQVAPSSRQYTLVQWVIVLLAAFWGGTMGASLRLRVNQTITVRRTFGFALRMAFVIALLVLGPLLFTVQMFGNVPDYRTFAAEWDARDQAARAAIDAGQTQLMVAPLTFDLAPEADLDTLTDDPTFWVNNCVANYYGLQSIRAVAN